MDGHLCCSFDRHTTITVSILVPRHTSDQSPSISPSVTKISVCPSSWLCSQIAGAKMGPVPALPVFHSSLVLALPGTIRPSKDAIVASKMRSIEAKCKVKMREPKERISRIRSAETERKMRGISSRREGTKMKENLKGIGMKSKIRAEWSSTCTNQWIGRRVGRICQKQSRELSHGEVQAKRPFEEEKCHQWSAQNWKTKCEWKNKIKW